MNFFLSLFLEITNGTRGAVIIIIIMLVPLLRCQPHNANVIMVYGLGRKASIRRLRRMHLSQSRSNSCAVVKTADNGNDLILE